MSDVLIAFIAGGLWCGIFFFGGMIYDSMLARRRQNESDGFHVLSDEYPDFYIRFGADQAMASRRRFLELALKHLDEMELSKAEGADKEGRCDG